MPIRTVCVLFMCIAALSCTKYAQISTLSSYSPKTSVAESGEYVFDNDTLKIAYTFWESGGIVRFTVTNKTNKPLYIDWKRCSYVYRGGKNNYFDDVTTSNSSFKSTSKVYVNGSTGNGSATDISKKQERVTFLPPSSSIITGNYSIYSNVYTLGKKWKQVSSKIKSKDGYSVDINKDDTKVHFRNFITYSFSENMDNEKYIDNEFYVSNVVTARRKSVLNYFRTFDGFGIKSGKEERRKFYNDWMTKSDLMQ